MHQTSSGRRVCRLSLLLTSRSPVLRKTGRRAGRKLRELCEYLDAQSIVLRKQKADPADEEITADELRRILVGLHITVLAPATGERRTWTDADVEEVVAHFDFAGEGAFYMFEVELTLARAMQPLATQPPGAGQAAQMSTSTMLPQITSLGRQALAQNRTEQRPTFNTRRRFVEEPTGAGELGPGAYLAVQLPAVDGRRPQPGKYDRKGKTQGIGDRPGPEVTRGGTQVPFSPTKSTASRRAPAMAGRNMFRDFISQPLRESCGPGPAGHGGAPGGARLSAMDPRQPQSKARNAATVDVGTRAPRPVHKYPHSETMRAPVQYGSGQLTGEVVASSTKRTGPQFSFCCGIDKPSIAKAGFADPRVADRVAARQAKAMNKHKGNLNCAFFGLLASN